MSSQQSEEEERNKWSLSNLAQSIMGPLPQMELRPVGHMPNLEEINMRNEYEQKSAAHGNEWKNKFSSVQEVLKLKEQQLESTQLEFQQYLDHQERTRQQLTTVRSVSEDETGSAYSTLSVGRQSSVSGPYYQQNVLHVDNDASASTPSRKRIHQVPIFRGTEKEDSYEWLLSFEKITDYYQWDDRTTLSEFMMALQGSAGLWWDSQNHTLKYGTYDAARKSFTTFFGGDIQAQSRALANIDNMRQGSESMVSFCPKLVIEITRISRETHIQLYFFYRTINSTLADKIAQTEPQTFQDAVSFGVRLKRGAKERQIARLGSGKSKIGPVSAKAGGNSYGGTSISPQPMEGVVHGAINVQGQKQQKVRIKGNCRNCGKKGHRAVTVAKNVMSLTI
ncbi:hypothetical protein CU098_005160, partial [Rhizopus stolonifer]